MKRFLNLLVLVCFCFSNLNGYAQTINIGRGNPAPTLNLLPISQSISHAALKGIKVNPDNLFDLKFIIDTNNDSDINKEEAQTLVNYFFAGLTLPEEDLWVNLSPYEQNRIIPDTTATTQLGEGLLKEDYLLKQLAASLTYPETELGKKYWDAANNETRGIASLRGNQARTGRDATPGVSQQNTQSFNKVWITPDKALIYENTSTSLSAGGTISAFITEATLKVLTEEDYLAVQNSTNPKNSINSTNSFKTHILPAITQQVNQGEHFSQLRQIYNALILGVWFKNKLKDSIYKNYIAQSKTKGIDHADNKAKEKIYQQYLNAFKQGAYNYVKKESVGAIPRNRPGNVTGENMVSPLPIKITRRAYFSGGFGLPNNFGTIGTCVRKTDRKPASNGRDKEVEVKVHPASELARAAKAFYRETVPGQINALYRRIGDNQQAAMVEGMRGSESSEALFFGDRAGDFQESADNDVDRLVALSRGLEAIDDPREFGRHVNLLLGIAKREGARIEVFTGEKLNGIYEAAKRFAKGKTGKFLRLPDTNKVRILTVDLSNAKGPASDILREHFKSLEGINYYQMDSDNADILMMQGDEKNAGLMAHELVEANNMQLLPGKRHRLACRESGYGDPRDAQRFEKNSVVGAGKLRLTAEELAKFLKKTLEEIQTTLTVDSTGNLRSGRGPLMVVDLEAQSAFIAVEVGEQGLRLRIVVKSGYITKNSGGVNEAIDIPWQDYAGNPSAAKLELTRVLVDAFGGKLGVKGQVYTGEARHEMHVVADETKGQFFFGDQDPNQVFADQKIFPVQSASADSGPGASTRSTAIRPVTMGSGVEAGVDVLHPAVQFKRDVLGFLADKWFGSYKGRTSEAMNAYIGALISEGAGLTVVESPEVSQLLQDITEMELPGNREKLTLDELPRPEDVTIWVVDELPDLGGEASQLLRYSFEREGGLEAVNYPIIKSNGRYGIFVMRKDYKKLTMAHEFFEVKRRMLGDDPDPAHDRSSERVGYGTKNKVLLGASDMGAGVNQGLDMVRDNWEEFIFGLNEETSGSAEFYPQLTVDTNGLYVDLKPRGAFRGSGNTDFELSWEQMGLLDQQSRDDFMDKLLDFLERHPVWREKISHDNSEIWTEDPPLLAGGADMDDFGDMVTSLIQFLDDYVDEKFPSSPGRGSMSANTRQEKTQSPDAQKLKIRLASNRILSGFLSRYAEVARKWMTQYSPDWGSSVIGFRVTTEGMVTIAILRDDNHGELEPEWVRRERKEDVWKDSGLTLKEIKQAMALLKAEIIQAKIGAQVSDLDDGGIKVEFGSNKFLKFALEAMSRDGMMANYDYKSIELGGSYGREVEAVIRQAVRKPGKNGQVDPRLGAAARDISLNIRNPFDPELVRLQRLGASMGITPNAQRFMIIRADDASRSNRVYGLAAIDRRNIPVILLREDLLAQGNDEQIKEALSHEWGHLEQPGLSHSEVILQQYQGGLTTLIDRLSGEDEAKYGAIKAAKINNLDRRIANVKNNLGNVIREAARSLDNVHDDQAFFTTMVTISTQGIEIEIKHYASNSRRGQKTKLWGYEELGFSEIEWQAFAHRAIIWAGVSKNLKGHAFGVANIWSDKVNITCKYVKKNTTGNAVRVINDLVGTLNKLLSGVDAMFARHQAQGLDSGKITRVIASIELALDVFQEQVEAQGVEEDTAATIASTDLGLVLNVGASHKKELPWKQLGVTTPKEIAEITRVLEEMGYIDRSDLGERAPVNGGIKVTKDTINLQTIGKGNDFKINNNTSLDYATLIPQVVSLRDLPAQEFAGMLER